ncbi:YifB family Mg chelatase-like AAA ATPase [Candidatus Fermentibacteria bacterium]|nr:YifB family Mg chelatase-like AAA ATPase [Candidatus Fermentibacteria bacterium]
MLARMRGLGLSGIDGYPVDVEVDMARGLPTFTVVGLPDNAVKEARERVLSAISNLGVCLPGRKTTVNLAPADRRKEGSGFDLPIAVGVLAAAEVVPSERAMSVVLVGELALDGSLRPVRGMLPMALGARALGHDGLVVPRANSAEASLAFGQKVYAADSLGQVVGFLSGSLEMEPVPPPEDALSGLSAGPGLDLADVRGQEQAKRALEVAAAGGHNILMIGPPGSGKTMLARRLPGILPPLTPEEALETTRIHSVAGMLSEKRPLVSERPFRAPHHTVSDAGLIGGGAHPRPGEASLAHNGVLFLDELPEFRRNVLEVLRQPMEDGTVTISRAATSLTYPARFMLAAAMNPCPCGYLTDPRKSCTCGSAQIESYLHRISGPLLDRIDIHIEVPPVKYEEMAGEGLQGESSRAVAARVAAARALQIERFGGSGIFCNAGMGTRQARVHCRLSPGTAAFLREAVEHFGFSARAYDRILKVSRTVADLSGSPVIERVHVAEAVQYRALDRDYWNRA